MENGPFSSCFNFHSKDRSNAACCFCDVVVASIYIYIYVYILDGGKKIFLNGKIYRYENWIDDFVTTVALGLFR